MLKWGGLETNKRAQASKGRKMRSSDRAVTALTPGACIRIVDGWVDVSQVNFAHEAIDLCEKGLKHACQEGVQKERGRREHETESRTHVELPGEACEAGLTIN